MGGLIGLAAMGHGSQIGAVRLHQDPVQGRPGRHGLDLGGLGEGDDAREAQVEPQVQRRARKSHVFAEAVDDPVTGALLAEHAQGGLPGRAGVDHQRLSQAPGQLDLCPEGDLLGLPWAEIVVPIQPRLAHEADLGGRGQLRQRLGHRRAPAGGLVGMHPQAGLDPGVPPGQIQDLCSLRKGARDDDGPAHPRHLGPVQGGHRGPGSASSQMTMSIHEHVSLLGHCGMLVGTDAAMRLPPLLPLCLGSLLLTRGAPLGAQVPAHRIYDHRDGLPQSQVLSLLEDRDGFLWMGTMDGVARLGSAGFTVYGRSAGTPLHAVQALAETDDGSIWAGGIGVGLVEIRGNQVTRQVDPQGRPLDRILALRPAPGGQLWVGTSQGLYVRRGGRFEAVPLPANLPSPAVTALTLDDQGRLWIAGFGSLGLLEGGTYHPQPLPPGLRDNRILALTHQPGVGLWLMTPRHLACRDRNAWTMASLGSGGQLPILRSLTLDRQGALLVALAQGGLLRRGEDGRFRILTPGKDLPQHSIQCVLHDRLGTLWFGTDGAGLIAQSPLPLRQQVKDPLSHADLPPVTALHELSRGRVLLATTFGLSLWEEGRGITRHWTPREGVPAGDIWSLLPDGPEAVILSATNGLARWQNGQVRSYGPSLEGDIPVALGRLDGRVWVLTERELLEIDGREQAGRRVPLPEALFVAPPTCMVAHAGALWIGTLDGVHRFTPAEGIQRVPGPDQVPGSVNALTPDPDGSLWVAGHRGIFRLRPGAPGTWEGPMGDSDLLLRQVMWAKPLPTGGLAAGLNQGLAILRQGKVLSITRNVGLASDETNQGAVLLDSQGDLWFGLNTGFGRLSPALLPAPPALPAPRLLEARWQGGALWRPRSLELPPGFGTLSLAYDTPYPNSPTPPRYEVWLEGVHGGWTALEEGPVLLQFAALPSGKRHLRVRGSLDGRTWSEGPPLPILVGAPWHARAEIRLLALGILAGLVGMTLRGRTRRLQRRNARLQEAVDARTAELTLHNRSLERLHIQLKHSLESRMQLVRTVSHDLRSPLTSILLITDRLRHKFEALGVPDPRLDILQREAERLSTIVAGLLDQSRDLSLADNLNLRLCRPGEVLLGITETLRFRAEGRGLESRIELAPEALDAWILADVTALQQVLFNLLENALKFTDPPGTLGLRTRRSPETFEVEVWDTGRGIEADKLVTLFEPFVQGSAEDAGKGWGLGLSICRTLMEAHGGRLTAESTPGEGSTFRVSIPLVRA